MASSSARQIAARVASRSGSGKQPNKQRAWLFPAAIVAIVVIGIGIVVYPFHQRGRGSNDTPPRAELAAGEPADHWHAAFAVTSAARSSLRSPTWATTSSASTPTRTASSTSTRSPREPPGDGAKMSRFFDQTAIEVTDTAIKMPDGKVYKEGRRQCDGKPGRSARGVGPGGEGADHGARPRCHERHRRRQLDSDYMAMTLAFVRRAARHGAEHVERAEDARRVRRREPAAGVRRAHHAVVGAVRQGSGHGHDRTGRRVDDRPGRRPTTTTKADERRDAGRGPGRGVRDPAATADQHHAEADAADPRTGR